jgi:hypothetical protein
VGVFFYFSRSSSISRAMHSQWNCAFVFFGKDCNQLTANRRMGFVWIITAVCGNLLNFPFQVSPGFMLVSTWGGYYGHRALHWSPELLNVEDKSRKVCYWMTLVNTMIMCIYHPSFINEIWICVIGCLIWIRTAVVNREVCFLAAFFTTKPPKNWGFRQQCCVTEVIAVAAACSALLSVGQATVAVVLLRIVSS